MEFHSFPARLTSGYNSTDEYGQGTVAPESNAVDFTGDFVPLIPLGANARVDWILGADTLASFSGNVYLSSSGRLRLVDIAPGALAWARCVLARNTSLPARISTPENAKRIPCDITYLSRGAFALTCGDCPSESQLLLDTDVDFLTLRALPLAVQNRVPLRGGQTILLCGVQPTGEENLIALCAFAARLEHMPEAEPNPGA